ncbi:ATP-binding protein [Dyella soli]
MPVEAWSAGRPQGLAVDYARLLASRAGLRLEFRPYSSWESVAFAPNGDIPFDMLLAQPVTPDRLSNFNMLRSILTDQPAIVVRRDNHSIHGIQDLTGSRVAVERRYQRGIALLAHYHPGIRLLLADDANEALDLVADGRADAYVGLGVRATALLLRRPTRDLAMLASSGLAPMELAPAVRKDNGMLTQILRKAESGITDSERARIREHWGVQSAGKFVRNNVQPLSDEQRHWLGQLPPLRVGFEVDRYPYTFVDSAGRFDGLAADYLRAIEQRLGLRFEYVRADDWDSLQAMIKSGRVDLVAAVGEGDVADSDMSFTQSYENFPGVIVTRTDGPPIADPGDLDRRAVAIRDESSMMAQARHVIGNATFRPVGNNEAGLSLVAERKADAYIGTLPAVDYLIRSRYPSELRVVGPAGVDMGLAIGVRPKFAALLPMINGVLNSMEQGERQAIRGRWLTTEYHYGVPWQWVVAGSLGAALLLLTGGIAFMRLKRALRAQVAAEQALAKQLDFQAALLERLPYPVFVKDADARYVAVNSAYESFFHCNRRDLMGKRLTETMHLADHDLAELERKDADVLSTGIGSREEVQLHDAPGDGDMRSVIVWMDALTSRSGPRLLGTVVDVSEIRSAEARARASEQRLSDITRTMPAPVFQLRISPDGSRKFTYVAGKTVTSLGMSANEIVDNEPALFALVHPDDQPLVTDKVNAAARSRKAMPAFDFRLLVKGQWRWLQTEGGTPRQLPGGDVEWSGYWIDTTRVHEQSEALIEARRRAEAATEAKGAFLAAMSHEIRTPMAGVLGMIELLTHTRLDREQLQMVDMAQESAKGLLLILDDILDYSRIDARKLVIESVAFDPRRTFDSICGLFSIRAIEKGLRLYCIVDASLAPLVVGDEARLRQIVSNLMSNAIKFTEEGSITLRVRVDEASAGLQHVRMSVRDTGIGIRKANLARLFSPFTQAEESTVRRFGGTGLGLAISRSLAQLMGGDLRLESEEGRGTEAILSVPLPVEAAPRGWPLFDGTAVHLRCRDTLLVQELEGYLGALGFEVKVASTDCQVDFMITDDRVQARGAVEAGIRCLLVNDSGDGSGLPAVRGNPLLWRALREGCCAALGVDDSHLAEPGEHACRVDADIRVLVAEDHPINRALIDRQMQVLGCQYSIVEDGEQALDALEGQTFDLLLTDCHMPNMDGFALARTIRARERADVHLAIVALSASALPEQVQKCKDAGMDDFLAKPMRLSELANKILLHAPRSRPAGTRGDFDAKLPDGHEDTGWQEQLLRELLKSCSQDLAEFDRLDDDADAARQHYLLHRVEGAIAAVGVTEGIADSVGLTVRQRRARIQEHLFLAAQHLSQLNARASGRAGPVRDSH